MGKRKASTPTENAGGWPADRIRKTFLRFFEERGHKVVPSSPLVPFGDPTLLFTTAGMVQFKPYFEGRAQPPSRRLASVQKCFRTSDIDSVGDASHLTFFEMLGNWSVGDYFKQEAIDWAWELATEVIELPKERLWAAVYLDDDEAYDLWRKVGVPVERIVRYGEEDNFWYSGEIGPCGPCSEIYYDFGPTPGCPECEKGTCHPQVECRDEQGVSRFLEIWNLVFMVFFRHEDGSLTDLPAKNIDTGAGLERWAAVLQNPDRRASVFDTDLFRPIIDKVAELSGRAYGQDGQTDRAMRIVAEHARAAAFLIADGVMPSNEGRGYVLRRIMRRAILRCEELALNSPALPGLGRAAIKVMGMAYPDLETQAGPIQAVLTQEEYRFREAVQAGAEVLGDLLPLHSRARELAEEVTRIIRSRPPMWVLVEAAVSHAQIDGVRDILEIVARWNVASGALVPGGAVRFPKWSLPARWLEQALEPFAEGFLGLSNVHDLARRDSQEATKDVQRYVSLVKRFAEALTGPEVFYLYDTYGFPAELTQEIARERGFEIDQAGFEREMDAQRERARAASRFGTGAGEREKAYAALSHLQTRFVGYETLRHESTVAAIIAIRRDRASPPEADAPLAQALSRADLKVGPYEVVEAAEAPAEVEIVLHETPFYPEGGGQVGDQGEIVGPAGRIVVEDTRHVVDVGAPLAAPIVHRGRVVKGRIAVNDAVVAQVDAEKRRDTMRNHTATHLLQAALRRVLGAHVRQSGSLVAPDRLRFDFTHMEALKPEEVLAVQRLVNEKVREDAPVHPDEKGYEDAIAGGALAFFGDKYADRVRVVEIGGEADAEGSGRFSMELCGGTHCRSTGEIGGFIIVREESTGAGVRRIEAVTGRGAEEHAQSQRDLLERLGSRVGVAPAELETKVASLLEELEAERRRAQALEREAARRAAEALLAAAEQVNGVTVVVGQVPAASVEVMRETGDWLRDRLGPSGGRTVLVLGAVFDGRPNFVAMVTKDLTARGLHAGDLVKRVAAVTGGGGGGRPEMAQAGGKDAGRLEEALALARKLARESLLALPPEKGS
jgi:alanyl-tRNA synthetase